MKEDKNDENKIKIIKTSINLDKEIKKEKKDEITNLLTQEEIDFEDYIKNEDYNKIRSILSEEEKKEIWNYRTKENDDSTMLNIAILIDNYKITKCILKYCKKKLSNDEFVQFINKKNKKGITPLHYSSFRGNIKLIDYLIKNGAKLDELSFKNMNVIHFAAQSNRPNSLLYFHLYHKNKFDFESLDITGCTPLHWACYSCAIEAVSYLLFLGVNINIRDFRGYTPLYLAVLSNSPKIVKYLLQRGASIEIADNEGNTPLDLAREKKYKNIIKILENEEGFHCFNKPSKKEEKSMKIIFYVVIIQFFSIFCIVTAILPFLYYNENLFFYISITGLSFVALIFWFCYIKLICSDPGHMKNEEKIIIEEIIFNKKENFKNICPKCSVYINNTIKHCIICEKCCKGFDHHCYWVNNCIDNNNYYLFIFFLIITYIDALFKLFITLFFIYFEFRNDNKKKYDFFGIYYLSFLTNDYYICTIIIIFLLFVLFFVISLFFLLKVHFKICCSRLHNNSLNSNRKTVILSKVNNDDLLSSENISESEI